MKKIFAIIIAISLLNGCATAYKNVGFTGGYSETQLDKNVFKVSFRGNGHTSRERVSDFTLLRSAELSLKNGYKYFVIIGENSYTSNSAYTTPTNSHTTGNAYAYGNYAHGSATTTTTGGQTYFISKPSFSNTIVCFEKKPDAGFSYSAEFIYKSITEKYGIKKSTKQK